MKNLGDLQVDILSSIVNNVNRKDLYTCTLINKQFYIATNPLLWRAPNVRNSASLFKVTTGIFIAQHPASQHIRKLDLGMGLDNITFLLLLKHVNYLEELNIRHGGLITDESFQHLPQHCPRLKSLHLDRISITQQSMVALGQHCHQLSELTLSHCVNLSSHSFLALVPCPLKTLTIISPHYCQDAVTANDMVRNLARLTLLNSLTIASGSAHMTQCLFMMNNNNNTTAPITPWPDLIHLHLDQCGTFDNQHIIHFLKSHPKLARLQLWGCNMEDTTLDTISTYMTHMAEIGIQCNPRITAGAIRRLIWNHPLLSYIGCAGCEKNTTDFPEAGDEGYDGEGILCLGTNTINKIRLSADPGEDQQ